MDEVIESLKAEIIELKSRLQVLEESALSDSSLVRSGTPDKWFVPIDFGANFTPGPFEPVFDEDGVLSEVGAGLWPWGRSFHSSASVEGSAKIATGFIWLRIDHPEDGAAPTAAICSVSSDPPTNDEKTYLPLYKIEDGRMVLDCRCLLSLAIRE